MENVSVGKIWTAPEILRTLTPKKLPIISWQKGDVYGFAVICQEIIYRYGPFWVEHMDVSPEGTRWHHQTPTTVPKMYTSKSNLATCFFTLEVVL